MNRNANSHFAVNPTNIDISRSSFDRNASYKTSFNVGQIIPFYVDEVLPGDTFKVKTSKVVRMQPMVTPVMDNIYLDTYYFYVPNRLVWDHWKQFNGENTESAWVPSVEYSVPQIEAPEGGWNVGTLADYFGVPVGVDGISVQALPFRAYALIMNEWFRDQNLSDPLNIETGDATVTGVNTGNFVTDVALGGLPYTATKYFDYFTGALPSPQKGSDVTIPVAEAVNWPVVTLNESTPSSTVPLWFKQVGQLSGNYPVETYGTSFTRGAFASASGTIPYIGVGSGNPATDSVYAYPSNLWAIPQTDGAATTINALRLAFSIQRLLERDARSGTRYTEILRSHFAVTSPDARLQRPEYIGGCRVPVNVNQVIQQSQTTETSPQGNPSGLSLTTDVHSDFTKSFVEHGFVIGLMVARYDHTYQQGIERFWSRKTRFDYYWPVFANIGEQAILNKEIYATGTAIDDEVFGYQEAWADYRYKPNRVTGEMRSVAAQSLDVWHLADDYNALPTLSDSWIREDGKTVDRVLAVTSDVSNQMWADIYVQNRTVRAMPLYSIPGLIDHH